MDLHKLWTDCQLHDAEQESARNVTELEAKARWRRHQHEALYGKLKAPEEQIPDVPTLVREAKIADDEVEEASIGKWALQADLNYYYKLAWDPLHRDALEKLATAWALLYPGETWRI